MAFEDKTRADLVRQAAEELRLVDATETLDAGAAAKIDGHVEPLLAELAARDVVGVQDPEAIPCEVFLPLGELLAIASEGAFGKPKTPDAIVDAIEERLRVIVNNVAPARDTLVVDKALIRRGRYTMYDFLRGV